MFAEPYLPYLYLALTTYLIGASSPGPATLAIMGTSMHYGRQKGMALALGITTGSFFWGLFAAFGLGSLMGIYAQLFLLLKILGGFYLLYLAWKSMHSSLNNPKISIKQDPAQDHTLSRLYLQGLAIHLTNPKAVLVWGAIITLGMPPQADSAIAAQIVITCILCGVIIFTTYALLFSSAPMIKGYSATKRWIEAGMAAFFAFAGIKILYPALQEISCSVSKACDD